MFNKFLTILFLLSIINLMEKNLANMKTDDCNEILIKNFYWNIVIH